jgi:hypothetical protein
LTNTADAATARKTALLVAGVLGLLAAWNVYRGRMPVAGTLGAIAAILLITGLFLPALALRFHIAWMKLAAVLGFINSRILLTIIFFLVIAPIGWIRKIMGNDPLQRRGKKADGYWVRRLVKRQPREQFERAF